jgi:hypothetical protein
MADIFRDCEVKRIALLPLGAILFEWPTAIAHLILRLFDTYWPKNFLRIMSKNYFWFAGMSGYDLVFVWLA